MPTLSYVGNRANAKVLPLISSTEPTSAARRPKRSPMCPKRIAPAGRTTAPRARMANVDNNAAVGSWRGKNCSARMLAKYPYTSRSYTSTKVPMVAAATTLR
jgi:hypothetical protein